MGGNQIRTLLGDKLGLTTSQKNEAMDLLKSGASYDDFKNLLKTYDLNSQTINQIRPSVNAYISSLASSPTPTPTPAPTPQTIGPLAPGVESIPSTPAFDGVNPYTGYGVPPGPVFAGSGVPEIVGKSSTIFGYNGGLGVGVGVLTGGTP